MNDNGAAHLTIVALLFGGMLMLGVAVDISRFGASWREASHLAATAAEAGAGWIDEEAAYDGEILVHRGRARSAARTVASGPGHQVVTDITEERVCVSVSIQVRPTLLSIVGASSKWATARSCAEPRRVP
jgi:hypothetical protein